MKSINRGLLVGLFLILATASFVVAAVPGPQSIKIFEQTAEGTRNPLANVRVQIGNRFAASDATGMALIEGLPAGSYKLTVQQPDYQTLSQQIELPPGVRQAIDLTLLPAAVVQWGGEVLIAGLDLPIAGVSVELQPLQVNASLSGRAHSITTWDGRFEFVDLPVGRYRLNAGSPGYASLSQEVEVVARDMTKQAAFDAPQIDGVALDVCREWGANCNKPAADLFCRQQGFFESGELRIENDKPPTRIITTKALCEHAGCDRIAWIHCVGELQDPLVLKMQPESSSVSQSFKIIDRVTGRAVSGATVKLAEAWPVGAIAEGKADAAGSVAFAALKIGAANRQDNEGKLGVSRRRVTAHVEATGYESTVVPLSLGESAPLLQVILNPVTEQQEREPNNDLEHGQEVRTGAPIRFRIAERGDRDLFKFRLATPAKLTASVAAAPLETVIQLRDNDGNVLKQQAAYAGKQNTIEQWLESGSYSVEVSEWGNNASDPDAELILSIALQPAVDPNEPNQQAEAATTISLNQQVSGLIWPLGDVDFYRLEVEQAGILRLSDHHPTLQRHVRIHSQFGQLLAERGAYENHPLALEYAVTPGVYLVEMREWGGNHASLEPYRLAVEMMPDDGVVDPLPAAGAMRAVRSLPSHIWFASTLLPVGDQDLFAVTIPGAGVLRIQSKGPMQRHLKVFDANGMLLTERGGYENHAVDLDWHAAGPQTVYVAIEEWGNNSWSALPYSMRVWFERADETDFQQRNEDFDHATPILPGDTLYGSYLPLHDQDFYALDVDFPGLLQVSAQSARQTHLRIYNSEQRLVAERGAYENQVAELHPEVDTGLYFIAVGEWGNNAASTEPYELKVALRRAEPTESLPLTDDEPRLLRDGEAQAFTIDQRGDRDRFLFETKKAGEFKLSIASQVQTLVRVFNDQTGERVHESGHYEPVNWSLPLKFDGPVRLRIELTEWGGNNSASEPGFIMLDSRGRSLHADAVEASPDGALPEQVSFRRLALKHAQRADRCELDLNGDGSVELTLTGDQPKTGRFPREGRYIVDSRCFGPDGQSAFQQFWVQATGNRAREGIALFLTTPAEGQTIDKPVRLAAQAVSYSGRPLAGVRYSLDGRVLTTAYSPPYDAELNWQSLAAGEHRLELVAYDASGAEAKLSRNFRLSEYFDISPPDGAVLSGESIRVSWLAPEHGESLLRFRKQGSEEWQTLRGQSGRHRVVELKGLEAALPYQVQPLGGSEPGPVYTLTRVKGLAFGRSRYGANIRRDYDQRVGISVRNNGDEPLSVRLECGKPKDPKLLVGFVGEGSEDKPIDLAPGQVREFLLGISAQDVDSADHEIPIRIVSDNGLSDEASVAVHVRLPHVELEWQDLGALPLGHGRKLRLRNKGDTITDLQVSSEQSQAVKISPTVQHGMLASGRSLDFEVTPRFYQGFKGVKSKILARGLDKSFDYDYEMKLAPGESARRIWLFPGYDPTDEALAETEPQLIDNALRAEKLDPTAIDWQRRDNPEDQDRDGRADRWSMNADGVRWVGDDTDADSEIDFIHADVGDDGIFEYSAVLDGDRWRSTNLVEAWLEMGFSLPWNRSSYHPHDTDIVMNGTVIGRLRDTIPEGNYTFRIPPAVLRFDKEGLPADNRVGINSKHLRGGHYVVNSDFRFKFRLTATQVWTVAKSESEARKLVANLGGVAIASPDLSFSSAELRLDAPAETRAGDQVAVEIPVRNIGSVAVPAADVALYRLQHGRNREEIARVKVTDLTLQGSSTARIAWQASAGSGAFLLLIDPDKQLDDLDRANNKAHFFLPVKGEEKPIAILFEQPQAGAKLQTPRLTLKARINEETGTVTPELSIDGGLWTELPSTAGRIEAELLLQPGKHRIELRVADAAGNSATEVVDLQMSSALPKAKIIEPKAGESIAERHAHVIVAVPEKTALVGVRTAGGPWHKAVLTGTEAHVDLPLRFGNQTIEAMVVNALGVVNSLSVDTSCSAQPKPGEERVAAGAEQQGVLWPEPGSDLAIDFFQTVNGVMRQVKREQMRAAPDNEKSVTVNTTAMDPKMRQRYEQAKRLRMEGAKLQAKGRLPAALARYRESLRFYPDYRLEAHIRLIEGVLDGSASGAKN